MGVQRDPEQASEGDQPAPTFVDYLETRAEQGCLFIGIATCGAFVAFAVMIAGGLTGVDGLFFVGLVIMMAALMVAVFVGNDVNYRVARMRERAKERAERDLNS